MSWLASYSRVGKPSDNAWSESFFANMKKKIIHWKHFPTRDMARQAVFEYIESYYNKQSVQENVWVISRPWTSSNRGNTSANHRLLNRLSDKELNSPPQFSP
ncbi:MAG: IS3 family transposase [Clostridiaceae bacterium]|nr:IS3 family transposase [Clostridiaceae bacterium]